MGTKLRKIATLTNGRKHVIFMLHDLLKSIHDIPGEIVECGIGNGAHLMAIQHANKNRFINLFDSFKDVPVSYLRQSLKKANLKQSNVTFFKGDMQKLIPVFSETMSPIAFIHINLYDPGKTYFCLEELFPYLAKGGIVLIDHYLQPDCRSDVTRFLVERGLEYTLNIINGSDGAIWFTKS